MPVLSSVLWFHYMTQVKEEQVAFYKQHLQVLYHEKKKKIVITPVYLKIEIWAHGSLYVNFLLLNW